MEQKQIDIKDVSSEELALMVQARYQAIMQCNRELSELNAEINRRIEINKTEKEITDATNRG